MFGSGENQEMRNGERRNVVQDFIAYDQNVCIKFGRAVCSKMLMLTLGERELRAEFFSDIGSDE